MTLEEWLKRHRPRLTQDEFGRRIGVSQGRVSQIVRRGTRDIPIALAIERETKGMVRIADVLPDALRAEAANAAAT